MDDGTLCVIPSIAALDNGDAVGLVRYALEQAREILSGTSRNDFRTEFSSYWDRCVSKDSRNVTVIEPIELLGESFPAVFTKERILIASTISKLNDWLSNYLGQPYEIPNEEIGIAIHMAAPMLPTNYPNTIQDLLSIAAANDPTALNLLKHHITHSSKNALCLFIQREGAGVVFGAASFEGLHLSNRTSVHFSHGFRTGHVPTDVLCTRGNEILRATQIARCKVTRADGRWIHTRGGDGCDLSKSSVLLLGCGSLGGYVAHLLSRAGVGNLTVTDNDLLAWENVGRHILGASAVGHSKAKAIAATLSRELPHLKITGIAKDWRDALTDNPNIFNEHNIVISTVADWRCEAPLNALTRKIPIPPLLLGWLEPFAVAGHCLVIAKEGGCYECAANNFGQFQLCVADFKGTTISKEPGGCTHYQNYGPTALMPVASMIATVAVQSLLNPPKVSSLYSWVSSSDHFASARAEVSKAWAGRIGESGFSRTYTTPWQQSSNCALCSNSIK